MEWYAAVKDWFMSLGKAYHVNPIIFGSIYLGAIPFFFLSLTWVVKRMKQKRSIVIPVLITGLFFVSAYLYLIIAGQNIPAWVYFFIGAMILYGVFSTVAKVRRRIKE